MTLTAELSFSGCCGQSGVGEAGVDDVFDCAESGAELARGLGLRGGEQRGENAVVNLGVEDGEGQAVRG